jgi:CRP-like cAMP-binding protein
MESFKVILKELIGMTNEEWEKFNTKIKKHIIKAKSRVINEGIIASNFYFIKSGLLRTYQLQDGKEINTNFACDGQIISIFASFITQTPSSEYLESIEDSVVYSLSFDSLIELSKDSLKFEKLRRIIAEENYLCTYNRNLLMQNKTAKVKYLDFLDKFAEKIVHRVPQHQIASYLGIAPESLSRIRKKI